MGGPGWLTDIFAALMLTVALYCASRLVAARWWRRPTELDTDGAHVVMGVAMAGMLVTGLRTLPTGMWEGVFAAGAGWFGWRMVQARRGRGRGRGLGRGLGAWSCRHPAPHLVECAAMLFMFTVLPASAAVRGAAGGMSVTASESRFSFLALMLALFMFGYVAWVGDRLTLGTPALALVGPGSPVANGPVASGTGASAPEPAEPREGCAGSGSGRPYLAPRCAALCKITMGVTMGYMLILML